jgi:hypothetical protein
LDRISTVSAHLAEGVSRFLIQVVHSNPTAIALPSTSRRRGTAAPTVSTAETPPVNPNRAHTYKSSDPKAPMRCRDDSELNGGILTLIPAMNEPPHGVWRTRGGVRTTSTNPKGFGRQSTAGRSPDQSLTHGETHRAEFLDATAVNTKPGRRRRCFLSLCALLSLSPGGGRELGLYKHRVVDRGRRRDAQFYIAVEPRVTARIHDISQHR